MLWLRWRRFLGSYSVLASRSRRKFSSVYAVIGEAASDGAAIFTMNRTSADRAGVIVHRPRDRPAPMLDLDGRDVAADDPVDDRTDRVVGQLVVHRDSDRRCAPDRRHLGAAHLPKSVHDRRPGGVEQRLQHGAPALAAMHGADGEWLLGDHQRDGQRVGQLVAALGQVALGALGRSTGNSAVPP
jgi:hypothetical protein